MGATKYQVLYRWYNEKLYRPILNNDGDYEHLVEFFTKDHKLNVTADQLQERFYENPTDEEAERMRIDAEKEKLEMIAFENSVDNPKWGYIYCYDGCKKVLHQLFRPECVGWLMNKANMYKISDISKAKEIGEWDYDFLKAEDTEDKDGYQYVMMPDYNIKYRKLWYRDYTKKLKEFKVYTTEEWENCYNEFVDWTPFKCKPTWGEVIKTKDAMPVNYFTDPHSGTHYYNYFNSPTPEGVADCRVVFITDKYTSQQISDIIRSSCNGLLYKKYIHRVDQSESISYGIDTGVIDALIADKVLIYEQACTSMVNDDNATEGIDEGEDSSFERFYYISEHYTTSSEGPYAIKDVYSKVKGDPWFVYSTKGSLNEGLDVARHLAQKVGIENVRLIKCVPITSKTKIK
jgi:hypothetical protein